MKILGLPFVVMWGWLTTVLPHLWKWKWHYLFGTLSGKMLAYFGIMMLAGLSVNHYTGEEIHVLNADRITVVPGGGSMGYFSLDRVYHLSKKYHNGEHSYRDLVHLGRFSRTKFCMDESQEKGKHSIHGIFWWEQVWWYIYMPRSEIVITVNSDEEIGSETLKIAGAGLFNPLSIFGQ